MSKKECVPVELEGGEVIRVMVQKGHEITDEDKRMLKEFRDLLRTAGRVEEVEGCE